MSVIFVLIPLSIVIAACFLGAFIWAVRAGQYEDTCTPSMRVLLDDAVVLARTSADVPSAEIEREPVIDDRALPAPADILKIR